jgi:hypothetical protein
MSDAEDYIRATIRTWVWSGFYDEDLIIEMLDDILEDDVDVDAMRKSITDEFAKKAAAEKSWPRETDNDRLDRAFTSLDVSGICAVQNAGYTMSDGISDVSEAIADRGADRYHSYCFYHGQDLERAVEGHGLMLAFGDLNDDPLKGVAVGKLICAMLKSAGFVTEWDGTVDTRINIPKFDWKRRLR